MLRFVGFTWNTASAEQCAAARLAVEGLLNRFSEWCTALEQEHFVLMYAGDECDVQVHDDAKVGCVVLGTLFDNVSLSEPETYPRRAHICSDRFRQIVTSRGRLLVEQYWGDYVAFITDTSRRPTIVLKDPTGNLPCFITAWRGVTIFFSHVADCLKLGLRFTINEDYLHGAVAGSNYYNGESALNEVVEIRRGECVELDPTADPARRLSKQFYWRPQDFSNAATAIEDPDLAASALRKTVRACTLAWASCHQRILHRLSGGLDSSIVLGCLKDAPETRIFSYTYFNPGGRSSELPWARLAAQAAGCEHLEYALDPTRIRLERVLQMQPSVAPASVLQYLHRSGPEKELASKVQATAVFNGGGGDSLFGSTCIAYCVEEHLRRHGLNRNAFKLALLVAAHKELSLRRLILTSVRSWLIGAAPNPDREVLLSVSSLVDPEIRATSFASRPRHPWLEGADRASWAAILQLGALMHSSDDYCGAQVANDVKPMLSPLYSQPVVELVLRIPVYVHFLNGVDRGLARSAFAKEVPAPILRRCWKDRAPGYLDMMVRHNRRFLRELFMDGILAAKGLLVRSALDAAFSDSTPNNLTMPLEIIRYLDLEAWAHAWNSCSHLQAAA